MASAWTRLTTRTGKVEASRFVKDERAQKIPKEAIEAGLLEEGWVRAYELDNGLVYRGGRARGLQLRQVCVKCTNREIKRSGWSGKVTGVRCVCQRIKTSWLYRA